MKLQDKETLNVADAVKDVLEGKKKAEQYDAKKDHDMDPKSHVVKDKKTGMYDVYNMSSKKVKSFKDKAEAEKYAIDNHDALMKKESPDEPRAKGEKDFKDKHTVKKSGMKDDGTNVKEEVTITLDEAMKAGKGNIKLDIDFIGDKKLAGEIKKKYKVTVKPRGRSMADVSGKKADVLKMLLDPNIMGMDSDDVEDIFPELFEAYHDKKKKKDEGNAFGKAVMAAKEKGDKTFMFAGKKYNVTGEEVEEELSDKQKKYRAFFDKALKKFKVSSPSELKGEKKKEFFDYVDANYEADNEAD